jgi:cytidylate kinase
MSRSRQPIIAIDGYSSTGKSTFARRIADALGFLYVDSGAMYRAVTLHCMEKGLFDTTDSPDPEKVIALLDGTSIGFHRNPATEKNETYLNDRMVEEAIRSMEVSGHVSYISAIPAVRRRMVEIQRSMGQDGGVVMDGRDIGTVVYPDADIKIFMSADPAIRAERRRLELENKGQETDLESVMKNIEKRDRLDSGRKDSPLMQAPDAVLLDNSAMTVDEQMEWFFERFGDGIKTGK